MEWLFGSTSEPYTLYRYLITLVLGGIWLFTIYESIVFLWTFGRPSKKTAKEQLKAIRAAEQGESTRLIERTPDGIPTSLKRRAELRMEFDIAQGQRIVKKLSVLKIMELFSLKSLKVLRKELTMIALLTLANVVALLVFYSFA